MVEVIWPLSVVPCRSESGSGRGVLPLRTFIQETLRRSRTSYSTLQVALYYLILIKPYVPKCDFTMEQPGDNESFRALQCGRRMFLASLILASKYLQDRNFSARAWSKISGLKTHEINTNEMTFLTAISWSLHIPDGIFERWTEIVLKYTPLSQSQQSPCAPAARTCSSWKSIVLRLTPKLDTIDMPTSSPTSPSYSWVNSGMRNLHLPSTPTPTSEVFKSTSQEGTPTPCGSKALPEDRLKKQPSISNLTPARFLEPKPDMPPPTPCLARMGPLPTPQMTPSSAASNTPAVSVSSCPASRRPSMVSAMAQVQNACLARTTVDQWIAPAPQPMKNSSCGLEQYSLSRRSSVARSTSSGSSPESMISDVTSRSSRASSISSVSSVPNWAPTCKLARLATCRNAKLPIPGQAHGSNVKDSCNNVSIIDTDLARPEAIISEEALAQSPDSLDCLSLSQPATAIKMPLRKKPRKRGRSSTEFTLQQNVRDLLSATPSMYAAQNSEPVVPDEDSSFVANENGQVRGTSRAVQSPHANRRPRLPVEKDGAGKKRACCCAEQERRGRSGSRGRTTAGLPVVEGPGMWEGVL
ncbi:hypothetical protein EV356DRAFT_441098 [Viridothelium virens]|uniref:Cyclin N-terminal domain-containing protein n=1 Tax=Viridothelium virens TaxID=1048519 RepID=A0A6A6HJ69_VIRVR|nr:hypothetical protein EV356DRAFT_441098 [Viridothelium virens]